MLIMCWVEEVGVEQADEVVADEAVRVLERQAVLMEVMVVIMAEAEVDVEQDR